MQLGVILRGSSFSAVVDLLRAPWSEFWTRFARFLRLLPGLRPKIAPNSLQSGQKCAQTVLIAFSRETGANSASARIELKPGWAVENSTRIGLRSEIGFLGPQGDRVLEIEFELLGFRSGDL